MSEQQYACKEHLIPSEGSQLGTEKAFVSYGRTDQISA